MENLVLDEPLLTHDDEIDLSRWLEAATYARHLLDTGAVPAGTTVAELEEVVRRGEEARRRFVEANLRLVRREVRLTVRRWPLPEEELFQEGAVGLVMAVDRFDHTLEWRFATYALRWIRSHIGKAVLRRCGQLHLTTHGAELRRLALVTAERLSADLGRPATSAEVAAEIGRPVDSVAAALEHSPPVSLVDEEGRTVERPDPRAQAAFAAVLEALAPRPGILDALPEDERQVLALRHGLLGDEPCTVTEVAARLSRSRAWVRKRERSGIERLRSGAVLGTELLEAGTAA
ncbi:sigma-70 family RNA polymerase sigma factor [Mariniluteicoccus endophyticus]